METKESKAIRISEETKSLTRARKGAMDSESWTSLIEETKLNIKEFIDQINSGNFSVNPLECSKYCIYKDICRFEKVLEVED